MRRDHKTSLEIIKTLAAHLHLLRKRTRRRRRRRRIII